MSDDGRGPEHEQSRTFGNLFLLGVFVVLVGGGIWMASALDNARRAQDCMAQGRRNCAPIDVPVRGG
jgi:hypothetical protein